jgi:hypothetical protein
MGTFPSDLKNYILTATVQNANYSLPSGLKDGNRDVLGRSPGFHRIATSSPFGVFRHAPWKHKDRPKRQMSQIQLALSVKQPWATLLAKGRKTIEIRRWPTLKRGRILIHAAKISDPRQEVWALVPNEWLVMAGQTGGIIGSGELTDCVVYRNRDSFADDQEKHLNDPAWFETPAMYGFVFTNLETLPFRPYPGWMRFFEVTPEALAPKRRG